jgi:hypothetical protein
MIEQGYMTMPELEADVTRNLERKREAETRQEPTLIQLFEKRMNASLDVYSGLLKKLGQSAVAEQVQGD